MALDRTAACQSWICFPCCKSCVYGICAEVFFFCSQTVLQMEHSLGVKKIFFPPLSPHVKAVFFLIPCLPVLSTPLSYVCCVCMDRLMANFTGTCTSDNKGLLLLLSPTAQPGKDWASCLPCHSNSTARLQDSVRFINNYPISFGQKSWCNLWWSADLQRAHCKDCSILQVWTSQHQKDQALSGSQVKSPLFI